MARISSDYDIAGTYGNLTIYRVGDRMYVRTKSSLDRKRFQKDPAFARSREKAKAFGEASRLAKEVYKDLPQAVKGHGVFGKLTGFIHQGLRQGKSKGTIVEEVQVYFGLIPEVMPPKMIKPVTSFNKKQSPPFSRWQVTVDGRLQCMTTSFLLHQKFSHEQVAVPTLPDG